MEDAMTSTDAGLRGTSPAPGRAPWIAAALLYLAALAWVVATGARLGVWAFLPVAMPLAVYVAWSDMARMKIPNGAVLICAGAFVLLGPLVLPWADYGWRVCIGLAVLVAGFVLNMAGALGAGDAKFAAAMAPYIAPSDGALMAYLLAAVMLGAFAAHRAMRAVPAVRRLAPDWESWADRRFPMGLALGPALALYLALASFLGA
jgi:prepilin peptidase CpaA